MNFDEFFGRVGCRTNKSRLAYGGEKQKRIPLPHRNPHWRGRTRAQTLRRVGKLMVE